MTGRRDELHELVDQLGDEDVPVVLAEVRRLVAPRPERPWPPAFFGSGRAGRPDVAARADDLLRDGFGRPA